jgi:hypothetical protein
MSKPTLVEPEVSETEKHDTPPQETSRLKHAEITDNVIADEFFADATEEIAPIVAETKDKFHPHLDQMRIRYVYDLAEKPATKCGKNIYAKAVKTGGILRLFSQSDFIIVIHGATWTSLPPDKRFALVDHELSHCGVEEGKAVVIGHDLEEFASIIGRHGFYMQDVRKFAKAVQMELDFTKGEIVERKNKKGDK